MSHKSRVHVLVLVCMLLAPMATIDVWQCGRHATLVADGGAPPPPPISIPWLLADGGAPAPPPLPPWLLADGGAPPPPPIPPWPRLLVVAERA